MSIFDINYNNKVVELAPPDKRYAGFIGWLRALILPLQQLRDKILGDYRTGSNYSQWIAGTYAIHTKVIFKEIIYESGENDNSDQPPSPKWKVYLPSFIGVDERIKFNGQKIVLEYALNKYFFTSFRQPPLVSDIFIGNLPASKVGFLIGQTEPYCSNVAQTDVAGVNEWNQFLTYAIGDSVRLNGYLYFSLINGNIANSPPDSNFPPDSNWLKVETIGYANPFQTLNNFIINIPSAVFYSSLPFAPSVEAEARVFVDGLIPAGLKYLVKPY